MGEQPRLAVTDAPRLADVAARAGVSLATASRALAGTARVSPDLVRRVEEAASELQYVVNPHARTLAGGSTKVLGLMVYEIDDPYFAEIAGGAVQVAEEHGWSVQVSHQRRHAPSDLAAVRLLAAQRVGAILVAGSGYIDPQEDAVVARELERFAHTGGRLVIIGRRSIECDAVVPDNRSAARDLAEYVLALGHRHVAVAAGPANLTTVYDRLDGIRTAIDKAGLPEPHVLHADFTRAGGREVAARVLDAHPDVTAILALNDQMAIGVLSILRERDLSAPEFVSVTGIDDIQVAEDVAPALTTVRLPMARMGALAAELALTWAEPPRRLTIDHQLVVRRSTGPPRH